MPVIPDLKFAEGEWKPAAPDTRAAMAPGLALAGLGETISETGGYLSKVGERIEQIRSEDAVVKLRTSMMNAEAEHEKFRIQNPDPATWAPDIAKRTQAVSDQFKDLKLSANARSQFDDTYSTWATQTRNSTEVDALKYEVTRARQNISNLDLKYRQNGDFKAAIALQQDAQKKGFYTPQDTAANIQDIEQEKATFKAKLEDKVLYSHIAQDPLAWLNANKENPEGMSPMSYQNAKNYAHQTLYQMTVETVAGIQDGIFTGDIRTPQDIDHFTSHLRPAVRAQLKDDFQIMENQKNAAFFRSPAYQNLAIGKASVMLSDYQQEAGDADVQYTKLDSLIRTLQPGPARSELESRIQIIREGKQFQIKTTTDAAMAELDKIAQSGRFGNLNATGIRQQTTASAMDSGLLQDRKKLAQAGLDKVQSTYVLTADRHALLNAGIDPALAGTHAGRAALFKNYYSHSSVSPDADPYLLSAFKAIHDGSTTFQHTDPELEKSAAKERETAQQSYGRVKSSLAQWLQLTPKATLKEINEHIYHISSGEIRSTNASRSIGSPSI